MQSQIFVLFDHVELHRRRRRDNLALVGLQLRQPRLNVRGDREDQVFSRHLTVPIVRVSNITDQRVTFILLQRIRPGTDWPGIDILRRALFQHGIRVLRREDRGKIHAPVGEERSVRLVQDELHVIIIDLFDLFNQLVEADVVEVLIVTLRDVVIRVVSVFLTHHREDHIIGIKVAGRLEVFIAVKFHALAQGKGVGLTVRGDRPAGRQRRHRGIFHRVEVDQAVIQRLGAGDKAWARAGDLWVKGFRRGFRAVNKGIVGRRPCRACRQKRAERQREQRFACRQFS